MTEREHKNILIHGKVSALLSELQAHYERIKKIKEELSILDGLYEEIKDQPIVSKS